MSTGPGIRALEQLREPAAERLPERPGDVTAVERQQRDEVEDEQRDVERGEDLQHRAARVGDRAACRAGDLAGDAADADDADRAVRVALLAAERRLRRPGRAAAAGRR